MKPSQISKALQMLVQIHQPVMVWSVYGQGKSAVAKQVAESFNTPDKSEYGFIDLRATLLDPVDLMGVPTVVNGKTHWAAPGILPVEGYGLIIIDELPTAAPMVQAALLQLMLDRKIGEYELPKGWSIIAAGNRTGDRSGAGRLNMALANRMVHVDMDVDLDDWVAWALDNVDFELEKVNAREHNGRLPIKTEVISFCRFRPNLLSDPDPSRTEYAQATPRTWEFVSNIMHNGIDPDIEYDVYKGTIGEGPAAELLAFLKIYRNLPNRDQILMDPEGAHVPTDPATLYAICGSLSVASSEQTIGNIVKYSNRLPSEFSVLLMNDSVKKCPEVVNTRAFISWASDNADVII